MRLKHGITWHLSLLNQDTDQLTRGQRSIRPYPRLQTASTLCPALTLTWGHSVPHGLPPTLSPLQVGAIVPENRSVSWEQVNNLYVTQALLKSQRKTKQRERLPLLVLWAQGILLLQQPPGRRAGG